MRYLSLGEALVIAEAVTGIPATVLAKGSGIGLLDSALHAPQASFAGHELYTAFVDKAAVLAVRIVRNHPLPDGNKRLTWSCLTMFSASTATTSTPASKTPSNRSSPAAPGEVDEEAMTEWIAARLRR